MLGTGMGITQSWFCACWDSSWVLYTCVLLVLVIWVAMATQHSFSWRSRMALLVSRLRRRGTEDEGEGAKKQRVTQPRDQLCREPPSRARRAARRRSIRQLLCDDADCALCNEAAREAEQLAYANRTCAWVLAGPGSPPPPTSLSGHYTPSHVSWEPEQNIARSQQEPFLHSWGLAQSSSSLQHEPPLLAWELRTGSSQHETFLPRHEEYPGPSPAQHEPFPPSQGERGWGGSFLRRGRARSPQAAPQRQAHRPDWVPFLAKSPGEARMSGQEAKRQRDRESAAPRAAGKALTSLAGRPPVQVSPGALRVPGRIELAEAETPFLQSDVRVSLERHVQVKRLQHALGLPCTLQRALKIFMPPAPKPTARRPSGAGSVGTIPQALPFLSVGSRTELERHLQRMVHLKRWGMPRRIQESLRLLMPATPPHPRLGPRPSGRWAPKGPGPVTRAAQTPGLRARASAQASQGPTRASESAPGSRRCRDTRELQGHIARKGLEIRLGALPAVLRSSQKMATLGRRDLLLPKVIPPGHKAPLARHRLCPLLSRKAGSVELNVRHKHIHYFWALPTLYAESLAKMVPCPPVPHAPLLPLGAAIEFCPLETPFVAPEGRELLERHVLRKRLQHEWGLPGLVRRSLRCFMPPPPTRPRPKGRVRPAAMELRVSSRAPPIPLATKRELEAHIRRRVAERRWGLPRRVRESLRGFMPPTTAALGTHPDTRGRRASRLLRGLSARRAPRESPSRGAPVGPAAVAVSLAGPLGTAWSQQLSRDTCHQLLERHVTRKNIEIRLGLIPRRAQHSQETTRQAGKLPLPRLIRPGQRSLEQRPRELFFLEQATSDHLELNLLHKHLSFRWGLPTLYRQSLAKLFHAGPSPAPPPSSSCAAGTEFTEQELPFLPPGAREELELHVRKKRLQHEWGLPLIVQKSMRGLMAAPPRPGQPKAPPPADGDVAVLQAELSFLSEGSRRELELSLRKRLMHRRWGLPRRIQESVRLLRPASAPAEFGPRSRTEKDAEAPFLLPWHKSTVHLERGVGKARRVVAAPRPWLSLGHDAQERLQLHVAKKCVETRLGAIPAAVRRSWQRLHLVSRLPLPKLIPAGDSAPKARSPLLPFVHPEDVCHLELNLQHKHLTALWGLGTLYTQSLSRMVPRAPRAPVPPREAEVEFRAREALFLGPEAREALELHVRKKRLQHEWGFPALIQWSLRAFVPEPPLPGPTAARQCAELHVLVPGQQPSLMDGDTRGRLERHLRKMTLQRRWGLPRRIQESLRLFLPPAPPGAEPRGQTQPLLHVCHTHHQGPTALSTGQLGELQPGPGEPLTHRSQHWHEMGVKEGKASCPVAVPQHALGSSSRRSQETSQTSDGEGPPGSPRRFPEDKAELESTLDFPGKKVLGISHQAQESQRLALRPAAHEPHPQQREQSSEESPGQWRAHDGEGAPRLAGTGRRSRSSSVETAVWSEKRISRELESSFRRMARSRSRHGPGGKQPLSLEIVGHLEMDHCTCLDCPCCTLEGRDGARSPGASSPVWQTQRIRVRGSATLLGDVAAPSPLHAEPRWQGQGAPSVAKDEPLASSPSCLEGSESRASDWSAGESARAASRPAPEGPSLAREHLAPPRAAAHRLDIHLAQKALGSFILPPCVIRSQAVYADMAAERLRAAAQEHRREMNIRLQRRRSRKSQLGGPRQEAVGERARPAGTAEPGFLTAGTNVRQTEALVLTEAPPRAEQPPRAPPGRRAESSSVPCKEKGPTFRGIMLGFFERVTSRASVGKRGQVERSVAAPRGAPPPPRKLAPSPKSVKLSPSVNRGNATEDTSGTVGASNLERHGHQAGVETERPQPGSRPGKSAGHVCWFHQHHAHAHLRQVHGRTPALHGENLCALRERMQARRRKLSPSLNSAASEEESRLQALDES